MNKNAYILASIVVAVLILVGLRFFSKKETPVTEPTPAPLFQKENAPTSTSGVVTREKAVQVSYTKTGFSPATLTVKSGTTVVFSNNSGKPMWVASTPHPVHTDLPGFDQLKSVGRGGSYSFTFSKAGSWKYHNHVAPGERGVVVVE